MSDFKAWPKYARNSTRLGPVQIPLEEVTAVPKPLALGFLGMDAHHRREFPAEKYAYATAVPQLAWALRSESHNCRATAA